MDPSAQVCPFCGELPGDGVFCAACGRNLAAVKRLPTRAQWTFDAAAGSPDAAAATPGATADPDPRPIAGRCAEATAAFLEAMRAAGNPGAATIAAGKRPAFRRQPTIRGWILREVDREDFEEPRRYEPGLVLTVDGAFHRLDSELRGWGQRDFPRYEQTVSEAPIDMPADERLLDELRRYRGA